LFIRLIQVTYVVHRDLRRAPGVRAAIDWVRQAFAEQRDVIAGDA
jgi:DNA-binding transcriptional LysR family regulator